MEMFIKKYSLLENITISGGSIPQKYKQQVKEAVLKFMATERKKETRRWWNEDRIRIENILKGE